MNESRGMKLAASIKGEDDDPVVGVVGPLASGNEVRRGTERGEQSRDGAVTPGDERMVAVWLRAKQRDECGGVLGADRAVEREASGVAERLEREARANAVGGVGTGVECVDAEIEAAVVEGLEVVNVGCGASFSSGRELTANGRLLRVAHDEHSVAGEVIVWGGCGGVEREGESRSEKCRVERQSSVEVHSIIVAES